MDQLQSLRPVLAAFAVFVGYTLFEVADEVEERFAVMDPEPATISCRDLIENGPPANRHIRLTEVWFGGGWCYQEKHGSPEWDFVLVPAYPLDITEGGDGQEIRLIVQISNIRGEADVLELLSRAELTAQVHSQWIPPKCQEILRGFYPQIDFDQCTVIHVGEPLPTLGEARNHRIGGWCLWALAGLLAAWWLADWVLVKLGTKVDPALVDPYAAQAPGDDAPPEWTAPSALRQLCMRVGLGSTGACVLAGVVFYILKRLGVVSNEVGEHGMTVSLAALFASFLVVSLLHRRHREFVREPMEPDQLPRWARNFFNQRTPELQRLGFQHVGDVKLTCHTAAFVRQFLSEDGLTLALLQSGANNGFSFDSLASDGMYLETVSADMSMLLDESLPLRMQIMVSASIPQAWQAHRDFVRGYLASGEAKALPIELNDVGPVIDYGHRIHGWSAFRKGLIKHPPSTLPRFASMAELKAPRRAVLV